MLPTSRQSRLSLRHTAPLVALAVGLGLAAPVNAAFDHSHAQLDRLLRAHVKAGSVNYGKLERARAELDAYVATLTAVSEEEATAFSRPQTKAFWINAYNALTLQLILDQRPKQSIRDIDGPWDKFHFKVAGREVSLNDIEHKILRPRYQDPRLHAVLVCAARSCPILESRAFTAKGLERRLDSASSRFAKDSSRNRFDAAGKTLHVSKIFEWYGDDFIARYAKLGGGSDKDAAIRGFLATELSTPAAAASDVQIRYLDYDWSLNGNW